MPGLFAASAFVFFGLVTTKALLLCHFRHYACTPRKLQGTMDSVSSEVEPRSIRYRLTRGDLFVVSLSSAARNRIVWFALAVPVTIFGVNILRGPDFAMH